MNLRQKKISREIFEVLSRTLHWQVQNPQLSRVNITAVLVTADLQLAKVYYDLTRLSADSFERKFTPHEGYKKAVAKSLSCSHRFFRARLSHSMVLRRIPELHFYYDASLERGARLEQLLSEVLSASH